MLRGVFRHAREPASGLSVARRLQQMDGQTAIEGPLAVACGAAGSRANIAGVRCTFDGTLHDRDSLLRELEVEAASDAELISRGYRRYGESVLERLRGRFAFVLWDQAEQRGMLGCDLLATQPLFLWQGVGYLAFADELTDLLSLIPATPGPDPDTVVRWLAAMVIPEDRTLFAGVSRLGPGHLVELSEVTHSRVYWRPHYAGILEGSRSELLEGLREQVAHAVKRRVSTNTSGIILSGGLDSSIVTAVATMVKEPGATVRSYSAVFPGAEYDEAWKVRSLTSALGIEAGLFELEPQGALWLALQHAQRWASPLIGSGAVIDTAMVAAAGRDGVEVVMDGQTGDEVFGCSPWLVADRLKRGRIFAALKIAQNWPGRPTTPRDRRTIMKRWGVKGAAPYFLHRLARRRKDPTADAPAWLLPGPRLECAAAVDNWAWKASSSGPLWWRYLADWMTYLPHRDFRLDYLRSRAADAGVVSETPLYDFDLMDYCLRLPPELAFDVAFDRPLAREAVRGLVPDDVRLNGAKANFSPFGLSMLTGADAPGIERLLTAPDAELGAYADLDQVRGLWHEERPGTFNKAMYWEADIWRLTAAECWLRSLADPGFIDEMLARPDVRPPKARVADGTRGTFLAPTFSGLANHAIPT